MIVARLAPPGPSPSGRVSVGWADHPQYFYRYPIRAVETARMGKSPDQLLLVGASCTPRGNPHVRAFAIELSLPEANH